MEFTRKLNSFIDMTTVKPKDTIKLTNNFY